MLTYSIEEFIQFAVYYPLLLYIFTELLVKTIIYNMEPVARKSMKPIFIGLISCITFVSVFISFYYTVILFDVQSLTELAEIVIITEEQLLEYENTDFIYAIQTVNLLLFVYLTIFVRIIIGFKIR